MNRFRILASLAFATLLFAIPAAATDKTCLEYGPSEQLRYSWRLRGGLAWIAGLRFPTSGTGQLSTSKEGPDAINSRLRITSGNGDHGFYEYASDMDSSGSRTVMSYHGYQWGGANRKEQTFFDYVKRLARIHKETPKGREYKVKMLPVESPRDILTGIFFLRQNAQNIDEPLASEIYSDGRLYPVLFRPTGSATIDFEGGKAVVRKFLITAAPGTEQKWPGGVEVWLTDDERRIPVRIELQRSFATFRLDLDRVEACGPAIPQK
jgi:Protein of unknown function (DUF3108).